MEGMEERQELLEEVVEWLVREERKELTGIQISEWTFSPR